MNDPLLAELIELAKAHTGATTVTPETRLYANLGLTGGDAERFMAAFAVKYGPDLEAFVWNRHFDDEPTTADLLTPAMAFTASLLSPAFAVRWQAAHAAEREITLAHLAEVARQKAWREPDISCRRAPRSNPLTLVFSSLALLTMAFFVVLGGAVMHAFLSGAMGERNLLALVGVAATGVLLPVYLSYASWRQIQRKLASAQSA